MKLSLWIGIVQGKLKNQTGGEKEKEEKHSVVTWW